MTDRNLMLRPGTILLVLVIAGVGTAVFNWAADLTDNVEENSDRQRNEALKCSELEIKFVGQNSNTTHTTVFVQPSHEISALAVTFESENSETRILKDIDAGDIRNTTASVSPVKGFKAVAEGCSRTFRSE